MAFPIDFLKQMSKFRQNEDIPASKMSIRHLEPGTLEPWQANKTGATGSSSSTFSKVSEAQNEQNLSKWVWVKIKDLGDHRFNFIFNINHPITGVLNFDSYPN